MLAKFYNVRRFAMVPMGAPFLIIIGTCVMLGAFWPQFRSDLVNLGFVIGGISFAFSWRLADGLDRPTRFQIGSLVCAIVLEFYVLIHFAAALQSLGERNYLIAVMAIVAVHFLIMAPAYGMAAISLTVLCGANAAIGHALPGEPLGMIWFLDGLLKALIGVTMLLASPVLMSRRARATGG